MHEAAGIFFDNNDCVLRVKHIKKLSTIFTDGF